jgi:Protein of unknown function (DUF3606)
MAAPANGLSDRIDLDDDADVHRWCDHFGVTRSQLEEAVQAAGNVPADVTEHLLNQGASAGAG